MFFKKSQNKKPQIDTNRDEVKKILSLIPPLLAILDDVEINVLTIGNDEFGATVQVRDRGIATPDNISIWLSRSIHKIKKVSWVEIEIDGHDCDGDYRSRKFQFDRELGDALLNMCYDAPGGETPIDQLILLIHLSQK